MSYILDALQRAEADRARGQVPGLHSQAPDPAVHALRLEPPAWRRPLGRATLALAVLMGTGAAIWWWTRPSAEPPLAAPAPVHPPVPAGAGPIASPATSPAAAQPLPGPVLPDGVAAAVLPILAAPETPPPPPSSPSTPSGRRTTAGGATLPAAAPRVNAPTLPPGTEAAAAASTAGKAAAPDASVRRWADLPPETRARLPAVNVSGSTYSQNPAHRMLIANGQVVQEGGQIAPGLTLETIGPRSAVLNHQGLRYSIGY